MFAPPVKAPRTKIASQNVPARALKPQHMFSRPGVGISNQAMLRLASQRRLHPKLAIGQVDDPLEHEADRIADRVMRMPDPDLSIAVAPPQLSRKCAACEESDELRRKPVVGRGDTVSGEAPGIVHEALQAPGQPLDAAARAYFELRFGRDFSEVRVHADAKAAEAAMAVNALAYTVGTDVVFAAGRYSPGSGEGRRLLAHELSHVAQQAQVQVPRVQRQVAPDISGLSKTTNYRFDTFNITERDLSDPDITARLRGLSKDQLRVYLNRTTDPAVQSYILALLAAPNIGECPQQDIDNCLSNFASFDRVFHAMGPVYDVMECYDTLETRAGQGKPPLTAEAACAQCLTNQCDGTPTGDLDVALTTCRDELLNQCIDVIDFWKDPLPGIIPAMGRQGPRRQQP